MAHGSISPGQTIFLDNLPDTLPKFTKLPNVADKRLGAKALFASDEFFAPKERLIQAEPAVFIPGKFDDNGKWMDGWESRRKRTLGFDYVIVQLACPASLEGIDIDTSHFNGNHPCSASLEGVYLPQLMTDDVTQADIDAINWNEQKWFNLTDQHELNPSSHHFIAITRSQWVTHVRLNIFPDGGVARLRVYGSTKFDENVRTIKGEFDLVGMLNGGRGIAASSEHFGSTLSNLLLPTKAPNMGEGWETRRRREPGNDWCILELGRAGIIEKAVIDTAFFKGNYPDKVSMQAVYSPNTPAKTLITQSLFWRELLAPQSLSADSEHVFTNLEFKDPVSHVRINIYPDGGLSRVRLFGQMVD